MTEEQMIGETVHYYRKMATGMDALVPGQEGWYGPWPAVITKHSKVYQDQQMLHVTVPEDRVARLEMCSFWNGKGERPLEYWVYRSTLSRNTLKAGADL